MRCIRFPSLVLRLCICVVRVTFGRTLLIRSSKEPSLNITTPYILDASRHLARSAPIKSPLTFVGPCLQFDAAVGNSTVIIYGNLIQCILVTIEDVCNSCVGWHSGLESDKVISTRNRIQKKKNWLQSQHSIHFPTIFWHDISQSLLDFIDLTEFWRTQRILLVFLAQYWFEPHFFIIVEIYAFRASSRKDFLLTFLRIHD